MNENLRSYQKAKNQTIEEVKQLEENFLLLLQNKTEILNNLHKFRRKHPYKGKVFLVHIGTVKKLLMTDEETIYLLSKHKYIKSQPISMHCLFELSNIRKFIKLLN